MDLFLLLAVSLNVLLTAVCAYCLSLAVSRSNDDQETAFLNQVTKLSRKFIIIGGVLFLAFSAWSAFVLTLLAFDS
jgi:hypothetical protein